MNIIPNEENNFLYLGLQNSFFLGEKDFIFFDLSEKNIKKIVFFLESCENENVIIFTNYANLLPLVFFIKKNNKRVRVLCNRRSLLEYSLNYEGVLFSEVPFFSNIVLVERFKTNITYSEYDFLLFFFNGRDMMSHISERKMCRQTYYKHRKSLMAKLNITKTHLFLSSKYNA